MATHHEDFEGMRPGIDFAGETLVHHGHHLGDSGPQHADNVAARQEYEEHIGGPSPARADLDVHHQGSTPKAYFRTPAGRVWMLKPYHENTQGLEHVAHYPLLGWSELASQGLYHAGGIGDLVQHSQATMHPISPTEQHQMVAIAFHPEFHQSVEQFKGANLTSDRTGKRTRPARLYNDAAKIAFMDFLTNHQDRHSENLLWGWEGDAEPENLRLHVIDNAGAFQYKTPHQESEAKDGKDHLGYYFLDSPGIAGLAKYNLAPWDDEHVLHAANWWMEQSPFIRHAFEHHVEAIKDKKVRRHISKNFHARADTLDRFSLAFTAAPKFDLYSPYDGKPRARKVAEAKMHDHDPVFPWAWQDVVLHHDDE